MNRKLETPVSRATRTRSYVEGVRQALALIAGNPLRAGLSGLAMAAAVATMAIVVTGLDGFARAARQASAAAFGADTFVLTKVATGNLSRRELADKLARNPDITSPDVRFLDRYGNGVTLYAPLAQRQADVSAGGRTFENAAINGAGARLFDIRDIRIERGRFFTRDEETRAAQVTVIGRDVADKIVPIGDPLGARVRMAGRAFQVVGVLARQGTVGGVSLDRFVWMPITAFNRAFGAPSSLQVFARAVDAKASQVAEDHARMTMRARRRLGPSAPDNFDLITPEASRNFVADISQRIGAAGPPISLMALLAAIVVIANTTLVSVTQRTREIGIRRAVGASRTGVLVEVLAEAAAVALGGGAVGLVLAALVLAGASAALSVDLSLQWSTALGSLAAAGAAGLAAGWYPARRAATVEVSAALRSE